MTETGWPLIPREVLPAPVPAAKRRLPPRIVTPDGGRQLPFFGAETTEPSPADLAGLLAGPGRLGRMGGTARVSVEVDSAWRVHVLVAELLVRGLVAHWRPLDEDQDQGPETGVRLEAHPLEDAPPEEPDPWAESPATDEPPSPRKADDDRQGEEFSPTPGPHQKESEDDEVAEGGAEDSTPEPLPRFEVLTSYSSRLIGLARAWPEVSDQLFLSGPRLRLWVAAAGEPVAGGYALGLDRDKDLSAIDAALVRAGLAGRPSEDGRHYRIMGKKRVRRLAELVGERPASAPEEMWPGGAGA
ncbi:hypothetical protein [Paractinoplanes toevensis]|uniref:Uncharacterized protein n=1 Tax=Paractinoplanes toevensis TaxID=571911 RepID=A0A919TAA6_9ACTN|nr:hypothetical protein Ato02nite_022240 [Actinoplanes toevensis]